LFQPAAGPPVCGGGAVSYPLNQDKRERKRKGDTKKGGAPRSIVNEKKEKGENVFFFVGGVTAARPAFAQGEISA